MAALPRPRAALAARTLLLASAVAFCAAVPVKTPTARPGECWNTMLGELKASDLPGKGYGLIFYGDSIVESLRGTDKCRTGPCKSSKTRSLCATTPKVLQKYFADYRPGVMGMSMDESAHLLWRLMNGQIPRVNQPKAVVLNIGTNDLTNCAWGAKNAATKQKAINREIPGIVGRIQQSVGLLLQQMPQTRVLVVGILPRGTGSGKGGKLGANDMSWPSHYTQGIAAINAQLKAYADLTDRVEFIDCGAVFIQGNQIDANLMADAVHPTTAGWDKLAACMQPTVAKLMLY